MEVPRPLAELPPVDPATLARAALLRRLAAAPLAEAPALAASWAAEGEAIAGPLLAALGSGPALAALADHPAAALRRLVGDAAVAVEAVEALRTATASLLPGLREDERAALHDRLAHACSTLLRAALAAPAIRVLDARAPGRVHDPTEPPSTRRAEPPRERGAGAPDEHAREEWERPGEPTARADDAPVNGAAGGAPGPRPDATDAPAGDAPDGAAGPHQDADDAPAADAPDGAAGGAPGPRRDADDAPAARAVAPSRRASAASAARLVDRGELATEAARLVAAGEAFSVLAVELEDASTLPPNLIATGEAALRGALPPCGWSASDGPGSMLVLAPGENGGDVARGLVEAAAEAGSDHGAPLRAAAGVASHPRDGGTLPELLAHADGQLFAARAEGVPLAEG